MVEMGAYMSNYACLAFLEKEKRRKGLERSRLNSAHHDKDSTCCILPLVSVPPFDTLVTCQKQSESMANFVPFIELHTMGRKQQKAVECTTL